MGRNEEALTSIERGIQLDETDSVAWFQQGIVLEKLNRNREALEAFDRSLELSPSFREVCSRWFQ